MRNSSSLDWLRFMHTPNDYRVSQRTRGIFPRMRYTSILTFHQTITLVCLSKPAEVRALHRFACRHKQKLQQQVCELREPKQTARVLNAKRFSSSVKGMLSHATPSLIS